MYHNLGTGVDKMWLFTMQRKSIQMNVAIMETLGCMFLCHDWTWSEVFFCFVFLFLIYHIYRRTEHRNLWTVSLNCCISYRASNVWTSCWLPASVGSLKCYQTRERKFHKRCWQTAVRDGDGSPSVIFVLLRLHREYEVWSSLHQRWNWRRLK